MNYGGSYQNSGGYGMVPSGSSSSGMNLMSETEYQRLSQTVGTNIQKMIQNGELKMFYVFFMMKFGIQNVSQRAIV